MDEQEILNPKSGGFLGIIITEAVVTAVILLSVIAVKYFFKGTYSELKKSPDRFYELFSEATYKYNTICDTLQKLQHANAMLVKVLNDLMNPECRESYNVKNQYIKNFTNSKTECAALIAGYETAKSSAESIVRYFNSAQYVITSGRFESTSANY